MAEMVAEMRDGNHAAARACRIRHERSRLRSACSSGVEPDLARADDAQMPGPEILDRSPVEILVDHRRRDVRGAADGRRISELLARRAASRRLTERFSSVFVSGKPSRLARSAKRDRGEQRPAPRPEVLRA